MRTTSFSGREAVHAIKQVEMCILAEQAATEEESRV